MPSYAWIALEYLERRPQADSETRRRVLGRVPPFQFEVFWDELRAVCPDRLEGEVPRRPCNGLNVEVGSPLPRCAQRSPDGRGLTWLLSGGDVLAYGTCEMGECPRCKTEERS